MISKISVLVACLFVLSACSSGSSGGADTTPLPPGNTAPVVNAGPDATTRLPADTVALNGTVSDDGLPAGAAISTAWSVQSGPAGATFADVNAVGTTVTFVNEGTYVLQLTADDVALQSSDTVTIVVEAAPAVAAVAVAPTDAALLSGGTEMFSASGTDQYGDPIAVNATWSATGGTIDQAGNYTAGSVAGAFTVTATDGAVSGTANVTISSSPPSADAGGPYLGVEGAPVALDGSASSDANNDIVAYDWDLDNDGAYDDASGVTATFAAGDSGVYTVGLRVTDGDGATDSDTTTVTLANVAPTANAGGPYSGDQGSNIGLDGSASSDPGNDISSYQWDLDNDGAFDDAMGVTAVFTSAAPGTFSVSLQVTDSDGASSTATSTVTVANVAPTADAGGPYSGDQGADITVDGSASSDPGNNIAAYEWDFDNDGAYDDATGSTATYNSTSTGTFAIGLRVTDADGASGTTTATMTVANVAPIADAGGPYSGDQGADITVDGSASSDPGNDIVSYEWDLDNDGAYDDATGVNATFSSAINGVFTIGLQVTDGDGDSGTATTTVTVANVPPTADAGGPYSGDQGADITVDGSASSDPGNDIVSYEWDLDNDGAYDDATGVTATLNSTTTGALTIGLQVTDGNGDSGTATAIVTVANVAPTAVAGGPYNGDQGADITVDGSGSSDPGNDIVSYEWDLDNDGAYDDATGVTATFNSAAPGIFSVGLQVTDGDGDSGTSTATVTVNDIAPAAPVSLSASGDNDEVSLDWADNTEPDLGASPYVVSRSTTQGGPYTDISGPLAASTHLDNTAVNGTTYYYVVTAEDAIGNISVDSAEVATTPNGPVHAYWTFDEVTGPALDTVLPDDGSGTLVGATRVTGVSGSAPPDFGLDLNGSSDHVVVDNTQSLNITGRQITMAAWIYPRDGGANGGSRVISKMNNAGNGDVFAMQTDQYRLRFRLDNVDMISSHVIQLDEWIHVAMVYDGIDKRIYINGSLEEDLQNNPLTEAKSDPIDASVNPVQLGRRQVGGRYFNGIIDEVQIYNRALTAGEVSAIHAAVTPVDPNPEEMLFTDITVAASADGPSDGTHGVAFADIDDDAQPDFYLTNILENTGTRSEALYVNIDGFNFGEDAVNRGVADTDGGSHGAVWADLDNDGDYDLFNGSTWDSINATFGFPDNNNVYSNNNNGEGAGFFSDETVPGSDIELTETETRGVTAFDFDGDGHLDLFGVAGPDTLGGNEAYLNNGSGNFVFNSYVGGDLSTAFAMQGVTDTDFDGDGDIDVIAASRTGDFAILQNDGTGVFIQIPPASLGITASAGDGITSADVDNDGDLDLLLAGDGNATLYLRNEPAGDYSVKQSFTGTEGYMGGFADLDNDGDLDLVFAGDERTFMNQGDGTFVSGQSVPVSGIDDPRAIAFADIDSDGDLDFAIAAKFSRNWLVRNDSDAFIAGNNWLTVKLESPNGQAGAFGAKVWVRPAGDGSTLLGMREAKGNHGYLAQDDPVMHFGLGSSETVVDVFVDFVECPDGTAPIERLAVDVTVDPSLEISGDVCPPPP